MRIRHNRRAPLRFLQEAQPALAKRLASDMSAETRFIEKAQSRIIAESPAGARAWLQRRGFAQDTVTAVESKLSGEALTLWAIEQALLDTAQGSAYIDERIDLERKASKLLTA